MAISRTRGWEGGCARESSSSIQSTRKASCSELIAAAVDELSRVVGGPSCALEATIGELRTPARPVAGF